MKQVEAMVKRLSLKVFRRTAYWLCASMLAASPIVLARSSQTSDSGWPTVNQPEAQQAQVPPDNAPPYDVQPPPNEQAAPPAPLNQAPVTPQYGQQPYPQPAYPPAGYPPSGQTGQQPAYSQPNYGGYPPPNTQQAPPPIPGQLTIFPGTFITVRINQGLSSDHSQNGDTFTATLSGPVVVNGIVVAEPGQTIGGVVVDVEKGGTQKLVIQLTDLTLVDGQRIPLQTQLIARKGTGRNAQDAGTIIGTTALGATIGAIAGGGPAAAVGAGAGLFLGTLVTHGHPSVVYPEETLTFQVQTPVAFSTLNAPLAFRYIEPGEYDRPAPAPSYSVTPAPRPVYYAGYPYPYAYPYLYPYGGPSVGFYFWGGHYYGGPGYYHGPGYYPGHYYGGGHVVVHGGVPAHR